MRRFNIPHNFELVLVNELYAQWIKEGRLKVDPSWNTEGLKFIAHDSCNHIRKGIGDRAAEAMRFVIKACVGEENLVDTWPNKSNGYCCGGGGGVQQTPYKNERILYGKKKFDQIVESKANVCITACHNCHSQIAQLSKHYGGNYDAHHLWTLITKAMVD